MVIPFSGVMLLLISTASVSPPAAPGPDAAFLLPVRVSWQVVNPADAAKNKDKKTEQEGAPKPDLTERVQTVTVVADALKEEYLVGPYQQPEWTQHRRFPSTRVYLQQPPGGVEFEQWFEIRVPKKGGKNNVARISEEFEFGLAHHLQLDIYSRSEYTRHRGSQTASSNTLSWRGWSAELRWAVADWDEVWGNPTFYFEYTLFNGGAEVIEPKLLLGGELASGWHWGMNFVHERSLAGKPDRAEEYKVTGGISHSLIDTEVSVGLAGETAYVVEREMGVATRERELHVGPSIQFRPVPKAHFDIEALWGLTGQSKRAKIFVVFGWDF